MTPADHPDAGPRTWTCDWRPREHAEVTRLLAREQFSSGWGLVAKVVVFAILVVSTLVAVLAAIAGDWRAVLQLGPLTLLVWIMVLNFARVLGWMRAWVLERRDPNVAHPFTWTLHDRGVRVAMRTASTELTWEGLHRVRETPTMFLFYYDRRTAFFLPRRVVGSPGDAAAVRAWIKGRLPPTVPYAEAP